MNRPHKMIAGGFGHGLSHCVYCMATDREIAFAIGDACPSAPDVAEDAPFQDRVKPWMMKCFGPRISADKVERNHRFLEEALELVQSTGCTASEAHQLVDYVFGRDVGETAQEIGGVMVTLAALCLAAGHHMDACGEMELDRIWGKVDAIRAKQAAKPLHSPLPQAVEDRAPARSKSMWKAFVARGHARLRGH